MRDGGEGNNGGAIMCAGGGTCAGSFEVSEKDCCRRWCYLRVLVRPTIQFPILFPIQ